MGRGEQKRDLSLEFSGKTANEPQTVPCPERRQTADHC